MILTDGCEYNGAAYAVGPFNIDCDLSCVCNPNGQVSCDDRCRAPFHPIGTTSGDPLCVEQPVDGDGCCVTIICSNHAPGSDGSDEHSPCTEIKVTKFLSTSKLMLILTNCIDIFLLEMANVYRFNYFSVVQMLNADTKFSAQEPILKLFAYVKMDILEMQTILVLDVLLI